MYPGRRHLKAPSRSLGKCPARHSRRAGIGRINQTFRARRTCRRRAYSISLSLLGAGFRGKLAEADFLGDAAHGVQHLGVFLHLRTCAVAPAIEDSWQRTALVGLLFAEIDGSAQELARIGTPPWPSSISLSCCFFEASHSRNRKVGSGFLLAALITVTDGSASAMRLASLPALPEPEHRRICRQAAKRRACRRRARSRTKRCDWAAIPFPITVGTSTSEYSAMPGGANFQNCATSQCRDVCGRVENRLAVGIEDVAAIILDEVVPQHTRRSSRP